MTTTQILVLVVVVLAVAALAVFASFAWRRRRLQSRFGPEYDRVTADQQSRASAERELLNREKRYAELQLRPIDDANRERYAQQWREVQAQFVTDPAAAVEAGDALVTKVVAERGYPTQDYDEQLSLLSVEHARTLGHYRDAHDIFLSAQRGDVSTEQLRQAFVHYREIFADVLDEDRPTAKPPTTVDELPSSRR
jgi:hypothetical protein